MRFIKLKIIISLLLLTNSVLAAFPIIDVQNVHGNYLDEKGDAFAEKAYYVLPKIKISHKDISISFNKKEKNLIINDPSTTVELEFDFSFLNVFKAFSFDRLDIKSNDKLFIINSEVVDLYISPKKYHLEGFHIETDVRNLPTQDDEDITIIDGLVLNAALTIKKMEFPNFDQVVFNNLKIENPEYKQDINTLEKVGKKLSVPMIVRFINYKIKEGVFTGRAKIDSYINLWLRIGGVVTTNKENTIIDIHLKKAKLGIFSIRGTLLKMVGRLNLDGVVVNGRHIIVDLATVVSGGQTQTDKL